MERKYQERTNYRCEANHVKEFFCKKTACLIPAVKSFPQKHLKELIASHRYLFIKSLQSCTLKNHLSFIQKTACLLPNASKEHATQSTHKKEEYKLAGLIDNTTSESRELSQERVKGWKLKEFVIAKKQLQQLHQTISSTTAHDITPFTDGDSSNERRAAQEWQDLLSTKEERHFQITRITKILST